MWATTACAEPSGMFLTTGPICQHSELYEFFVGGSLFRFTNGETTHRVPSPGRFHYPSDTKTTERAATALLELFLDLNRHGVSPHALLDGVPATLETGTISTVVLGAIFSRICVRRG